MYIAGGKKKTGYVLAEKFDPGFEIKDNFKNIWTLGTPIGQGGFGLIYSGESIWKKPINAKILFCYIFFFSASKGASNDNTEYVIKK